MKKIASYILLVVCFLCMTCSAFANNPYQDAHGQGYSEYSTPTGTRPNSGTTTPTTPASGGNQTPSQPQAQTSDPGYMPGSNTSTTPSTPSGGSGYSGSGGTSGGYSGGSYTYVPSSGTYVYNGSGSSSGGDTLFNASIGSGGSLILSLPHATETSATDTAGATKLIISKYKMIGTLILGICVITAIISLLFQITKLGAAGDNQMMRAAALKGIFFSGGALALFGSISVFAMMFWGFLK